MPTPAQMYAILDSLVASESLTIDALLDYTVCHTASHLSLEENLRESLRRALDRAIVGKARREFQALDISTTVTQNEVSSDNVENQIFNILSSPKKQELEKGPTFILSLEEFGQSFLSDSDDENILYANFGPVEFEITKIEFEGEENEHLEPIYEVELCLVSVSNYKVASLGIAFGLSSMGEAVSKAHETMKRLFLPEVLQDLGNKLKYLSPDLDVDLEPLVRQLQYSPKSAIERISEEDL